MLAPSTRRVGRFFAATAVSLLLLPATAYGEPPPVQTPTAGSPQPAPAPQPAQQPDPNQPSQPPASSPPPAAQQQPPPGGQTPPPQQQQTPAPPAQPAAPQTYPPQAQTYPPQPQTYPPQAYPGTPAPPPHPPPDRRLRTGRSLMISGWTMFGATYLMSAIIGTISIDTSGTFAGDTDAEREQRWGRRMTIPIGGPFAAIPVAGTATGKMFSGLSGVVQTGGVAMGIAGAVLYSQGKRSRAVAWSVTPSDGGAALRVAGRF